MNRSFYADDDRDGYNNWAYEAELLKARLEQKFGQN